MTDVHVKSITSPADFPTAATCSSADLDDARALLNRFYYAAAVDVPEPRAEFGLQADVVRLGPLTVGQLGFRGPVGFRVSETDAYHVTVPIAGTMRAQHAGHRVLAGAGRAVLFGPCYPIQTLHDPHSSELDIKIERSALEAELAALLGRRVTGPLCLPPLIDLTTGPMRSWARLVRLLRGEITHPSSLLRQPIVVSHLRHSVLSGLLLSLPHRYSEELAAPVPPGPPRAIQHVVDAIHDEPERPFTVGDLAAVAGVSVRSLQEGFRRYVGNSPMAYLQQVRLARAHETLKREDPSRTTVASVAHRWGFAHLGRFASAYHARYGAHPSQTLRGTA
ncbi:AraC family transcriptional regulator [Actinoplanes sp. N902-109]|uniref:helix-turn-helix transcriptional regulator n=1 Tax=Actinoplanes sp. (strain N902-109) TaxID=649831 RepID=UPI00032948E7|nr:AraC family transcriptional regulator [Actinoplanes sp. N902-109]AGL20637.1 transcriptional regulator, AraC family [Actinoplanes sp. N902-109]